MKSPVLERHAKQLERLRRWTARRRDPGKDKWQQRLWLYVAYDGRCARCNGFLSVAGLVPVKLDQFYTVPMCGRCKRAGGASRLRAVHRGRIEQQERVMIDESKYPSSQRPALKPESIGYPKVQAAVLQIADVDPEVEIPDGDGVRVVLTLVVKEFPDLTYYTNATSRKALIAKLGLNERKWVGAKVPFIVVQTNNPQTKKAQASLWVAPEEEWAAHLKKGSRR